MGNKRKWLLAWFGIVLTSLTPVLGGAAQQDGIGQTNHAEKQFLVAKSESTSGDKESNAHTPTTPVTDSDAGGTGGDGGSLLELKSSLYPVTAVTKITENDKLELYMDENSGNVRLVDKETGVQWLGAPQVDRTTMPNNKKFMDSPVHLKYTEGTDTVQTYTLKEKENELEIERLPDGARVTFTLAVEKLSLAVEYHLREDGLEVNVPEDAIREEGVARLISVEVLPFFNAATGKDEGSMFLPDGSGALVHYKEQHPMFFSGYSEYIYGTDPAYMAQSHVNMEQQWRQTKPPKERVALPVYGNYRNGVGFLGIVTQGQYDAKINGTPSGIRNIPLYRTSAEFIYRKDDVIFIGSSGQIPFFQAERISGDRQARFVVLQGEAAGYVGMAQAYRQYLMKEQGIEPVQTASVPLSITLMGGILRDEIIGTTFIPMTTFRQAVEIIDAFADKGIQDLSITFKGWSRDGLYGNQPDHFPVERALGGKKELQALVAYAKQRGVQVYLEANYARAYSDSDAVRKNRDAIRGMDQEAVASTNYDVASGWNDNEETFYWLKPQRVVDQHLSDELEDYAETAVDGVQLAYWGSTLYSDLDPDAQGSRSETAESWTQAADRIREQVGAAGVEYGYAYMFGHVDRIQEAPMDSSHFVYANETIPFYQLVVRGMIPYTGKASNLRHDARVEQLRMLEYGALPALELTYASTSMLQRTMEDRLWSSDYRSWIKPAVEEYGVLRDWYEGVQHESISNHERIQSGVYRTTFSNGLQVMVNYGVYPVTFDGVTIPPLGYVLGKGGQ